MAITTDVRNGHTLVFTETATRHSYKLDGLKLPGATDVKKAYPMGRQLLRYYVQQGIEEFDSGRKLKAQADVGTVMHDYLYKKRTGQAFDYSVIEGHPDKEKIKSRILKCAAWLDKQTDKILMAEKVVARVCAFHKRPENIGLAYPDCLCYAGKFDVLVERAGKVILQDYKSAKGHFVEQYIQGGGYASALADWYGVRVDGLEIIRVNENVEEPSAYLIDEPLAVSEFQWVFNHLRETRNFQYKWEKHFQEKYERENPWITKSKKKK